MIIDFWSDIENIKNASPENLQSDILAYLSQREAYKSASEINAKKYHDSQEELKTLQQQNKQMRELLEWINEYREKKFTLGGGETEEAVAFLHIEGRVHNLLQIIQGG